MTPEWIFKGYVQFRADPANDDTTDGQWCAQQKVPVLDLRSWKQGNPMVVQKILDARRAAYTEQLIEVDKALLEKAKGGDTKSIELLWRRFESWSPKQSDAVKTPGAKTFADLIAEA